MVSRGEVHLEHARDSDRARTIVHLVQREVRVITRDVQQICDHVSKHLLGRELVLQVRANTTQVEEHGGALHQETKLAAVDGVETDACARL